MDKFTNTEISELAKELLDRMLQTDRVLADMRKTADKINKKYCKLGDKTYD